MIPRWLKGNPAPLMAFEVTCECCNATARFETSKFFIFLDAVCPDPRTPLPEGWIREKERHEDGSISLLPFCPDCADPVLRAERFNP